MNYQDFLEDFNSYNEWNNIQKKDKKVEEELDTSYPPFKSNARSLPVGKKYFPRDDRVNSPSHYTSGKQEAIDIIEAAIKDAPDVTSGMLQGQVLKYLLRVWLKDNPIEDLQKAQRYLSRLIDKHSNNA